MTTIGKQAFESNLLTSVVIPNSVTEIGLAAFGYNQLTSVVISNYETVEINNSAFVENPICNNAEFIRYCSHAGTGGGSD